MKESQNTQSASCFDFITSLPPSDYAFYFEWKQTDLPHERWHNFSMELNMQEDNAADVVQSNDIKGNLVCIYRNKLLCKGVKTENSDLFAFFKHFKMAVFNL